MKIIKARFTVETSSIQSVVTEIVSIGIGDHYTKEEIQEAVEEEYRKWVFENHRGGYKIL